MSAQTTDCEYAEVPDGGITWESPAIPVPIEIDKDDPDDLDDNTPWSGATLSEGWWSVLYGYTDDQWTPFFSDRPREPRPPAPRRPRPGKVVKFRSIPATLLSNRCESRHIKG
jgi:hypothetical protein